MAVTTIPDAETMRSAAQAASALMRVLANTHRMLLLCELADGEKNVGELQEAVGVVQPTLSQQLAVLRDEELVETRRDGKNIYYSIASPQALAVLKVLYQQYCTPVRAKGKAK
jgi:DNA-binding transcriptional ArsR family regulator